MNGFAFHAVYLVKKVENQSDPFNDSRYRETIAGSNQAEIGTDQGFSKEQLDIAFAAQALQSGVVSERELSSAMSNWTIHGSVSLEEYLLENGVLDESKRSRLASQAKQRLSNSSDAFAGTNTGSKSVLMVTLDSIDPSGTIARLMGIRAAAGTGAIDATGNRQATTRFRLVRKLGQGGLGRVWLAFDESLNRHVAVKEITAQGDDAALDRFRREAEITGRLEHPGIVPIYQLGEDSQTGEVFYVMRFLGRATMHDAINEYHERRNAGDDDPMLIRRLLTDFVSACQAIGHAHSRKVIHRDLKPENIAIDSFGQVIVIDWGIAKIIDSVSADDYLAGSVSPTVNGSTMEGQVLGTPLYMAPEQAAGRVDELDERTDIFGLGAILFSILTGYAPHEKTRETSAATTGRQLLAAITSEATPNAREVCSDVDPALAAICAKAMARRQYARYQTASQLADDIQRWMAGERVSAYQETPTQRVSRWINQNRIWAQFIAAGIIVAIVSMATIGINSWQDARASWEQQLETMRGQQREIEVQVKSTAQELSKDARFMSTLPPIQGIIDARSSSVESESEEVWHDRLETIFEGLLRANPNYLAVSYVAHDDSDEGKIIVRLERNLSDATYIRRVPPSRREVFPHPEVYTKSSALPPGESHLAIEDDYLGVNSRRDVRLIATTPVYDKQTGDYFGIVAVELNLLDRLTQVLGSIEHLHATIYVTNSDGHIWLIDSPKNRLESVNQVGLDRDSPAVDLNIGEDRSLGLVARPIQMSPFEPLPRIGVVVTLEESE